MPNNFLITGSPRIGKTTVIEKVSSNLEAKGYEIGGIYCPEIREGGVRKGFEIVDLLSEESRILAHVDIEDGPRVSKYHVAVSNVDEVSKSAIPQALEESDFLVIDEIAPMETYSDSFKQEVRAALDSEKPLVAAIHKRSSSGFIGEVKNRMDSRIFEVTEDNRDELPRKLTHRVLESLT